MSVEITNVFTDTAANGITALTGDVSASGPGSSAGTVNSVGTSSASNIHSAELLANAATSSNTASTIVKRGASGEFTSGAQTIIGSVDVVQLSLTSNLMQTSNVIEILDFGSNDILTLTNVGNLSVDGEIAAGSSKKVSAAYYQGQAAMQASVGVYRLANTNSIAWRNADNDGDIVMTVDAGNAVEITGGSDTLSVGAVVVDRVGITGDDDANAIGLTATSRIVWNTFGELYPNAGAYYFTGGPLNVADITNYSNLSRIKGSSSSFYDLLLKGTSSADAGHVVITGNSDLEIENGNIQYTSDGGGNIGLEFAEGQTFLQASNLLYTSLLSYADDVSVHIVDDGTTSVSVTGNVITVHCDGLDNGNTATSTSVVAQINGDMTASTIVLAAFVLSGGGQGDITNETTDLTFKRPDLLNVKTNIISSQVTALATNASIADFSNFDGYTGVVTAGGDGYGGNYIYDQGMSPNPFLLIGAVKNSYAAPDFLETSDVVGVIYWDASATGAVDSKTPAQIQVDATEDHEAGKFGASFTISTCTNGTDANAPRLIIEGDAGNVLVQGALGVGNSTSASVPGTVTKKIEIFDETGASLGFIAVYDAIV